MQPNAANFRFWVAADMGDLYKSVAKLVVLPDGRTAKNWAAYKMQLEETLAARESDGIRLDHVLLAKRKGLAPPDPGEDEEAWIAGAPEGTERTPAAFNTAYDLYDLWLRANKITHGYIMGSLPTELYDECTQRPNAAALWRYLDQRFSEQTMTSVCMLWARIFQLRLDDYGGISDYLTALNKIEFELKRNKLHVEESLLAGAIILAVGDRYPVMREILRMLPIEEQTKQRFSQRFLEAERNEQVSAEVSAMTLGGTTSSSPSPSHQQEFAGAATSRSPLCKYVRKHQGKYKDQRVGAPCGRRHLKASNCWARKDDAWLAANPGKTGQDLPSWRDGAGRQEAQSSGNVAGAYAVTKGTTMSIPSVPSEANDFEEGSFLGYVCALREPQQSNACSANSHSDLPPCGAVAGAVTVALDSGATTSCFRQGTSFELLREPVPVRGALPGQVSIARGTTCIPCPALPSGVIRGLHSPDFRHNLVSVSELQQQGLDVVFPAKEKSAYCKDPQTGKVLWSFQQGQLGLYEAKVRDHTAATALSPPQSPMHPSVLLHRKLGHMGVASLRLLCRKKAIDGLPDTFTPPPLPFTTECVPCIQGKTQARPHPLTNERATRVLLKAHVDLEGPFPVGLRGHRYLLIIVDDFSRYGWAILLFTKDQAKHRIIEWQAMAENQSGETLKELHADRGGEFLNDTLLSHCRERGVTMTFSNPHSPEQNGVAEARNKQVLIFTRLLLLHSSAPQSYWSYAVKHASLLNNLVPHRLLEGSTPYQAWHKTKPSVWRLMVWGCVAHVLLNKSEKRQTGGKLGPVTKACMVVGINPSGPGWLLLDPTNRKEFTSSDVVFQEHISYHQHDKSAPSPEIEWVHFDDTTATSSAPPAAAVPPAPPSSDQNVGPPGTPPPASAAQDPVLLPASASSSRPNSPAEPGSSGAGQSPAGQSRIAAPSRALAGSSQPSNSGLGMPAPAAAPLHFPAQPGGAPSEGAPSEGEPHPGAPSGQDQGNAAAGPRRSLRLQGVEAPWDGWGPGPAESLVAVPGELEGFVAIPKQALLYLQEVVKGETGDKSTELVTPDTWQEALGGDQAPEWLESQVREVTGLEAAGTYILVPRESGKNILKCKWVSKIKRRPDGTPLFKSRIVAKGCSQKQGVDYFETYAPTAKQVTGRLVLHLAAHHGFHVQVMDVDQAFCHGDLSETIYMEPPPGPAGQLAGDKIWLLKRPLYGLKQAPRQWHAKLKEVLLKLGFQPAPGEPSLFMYQASNGFWILVYVDDMLLLCKSDDMLKKFKAELCKHFPMKDLGDVSQYLGMEIQRDWEKQEIYLSQDKYIKEVLKRFGQESAKEYSTPLQVNHNLGRLTGDEEPHPDQDRYPELIGAVMYIMVCTRPDIAHTVSVLSRFVAPGRHGATHWKAALRLLGYLKATAHYKLTLGGPTSALTGYSDSSWADDQTDRRSSQGHCFTMGSGVISWKATRSPAVALSTCEAELYAVCAAAQEGVWLTQLLATLGYPQDPPPMLWCDNESTVALTKDAMFTGRSKHIEARYYFVRELVQEKKLRTAHISGEDNLADIFTKPLLSENHSRLRTLLGVKEI